ncbi:Hint domain-containing protein [Psychromarinibacter halotolerans]|uniref:Hint domain-containing protein n=1 Tax=Psychromarinibacter halotolerans TaxID=1775175 RepID=A0ABV7GUM7_9RHOB|nr:Hint domain-containing protein [Psychromarinibacter halotolerans]MDF0594786.1 Hint domain-containing protein [Psychromarinibacter halotolerans]
MVQTTATLAGVVINEIGGIPFGAGHDLNGDGSVDAQDEFIELYNTSGASVDVSGWQLWEDNVLKATLDPGTIIAPGDYLVLVDGVDNANAIQNVNGAASQYTDGELTLSDGDVVILYNATDDEYVVFQGANADGADVTAAVNALLVSHPSASQVGPTEQGVDDTIGNSTSRVEDGDDVWADQGITPGAANCFLTGTRIETPKGPRAIEDLAPGDAVLTSDGRSVPVRFVFRQEVRLRGTMAARLEPVRLRAGSLGIGLPSRDLVVTADHGIVLDGLLVNAGALVNGDEIAFVPHATLPARITYWHIETDAHEVLLAEGVPVESFADVAGRGLYDNHSDYLALYGADRLIPEMDLPRVASVRLLPEALKERLDEGRAGAWKASG